MVADGATRWIDRHCEVIVVANALKYWVDSCHICQQKIRPARRWPWSHHLWAFLYTLTLQFIIAVYFLLQEILELFNAPGKCPPPIRCYDMGGTGHWMVMFDTGDAAKEAYTYIHDNGIQHRGKPVHVSWLEHRWYGHYEQHIALLVIINLSRENCTWRCLRRHFLLVFRFSLRPEVVLDVIFAANVR